MLQVNVGLVDKTGDIDPAVLSAAAAALNVQVTRDLPQFWGVSATVRALPYHRAIPKGIQPVYIVDTLPPDEGGVHLTRHNQPYAEIVATPGSNDWVLDASHETIEMLIDPSGNRLQVSQAIAISEDGKDVVDASGSVEYLVEACDPCEAGDFAYTIEGFQVSDFLTPHYYDPTQMPGTRYSFTGAITRPRQMLPGGYITWVNPENDDFEQILWLGEKPVYRSLGPANAASLRQFVDGATFQHVRRSLGNVSPGPRELEKKRAPRAA